MDDGKIAELFAEESFVQAMMQADSPEELQKLFAENGLTLSPVEITDIQSALKTDDGEGDLSDDDLESVIGGASVSPALGEALFKLREALRHGPAGRVYLS